ncbi:hypothetical protein BOX15_Mlig014338g1, partial [Macrostomum lignano]
MQHAEAPLLLLLLLLALLRCSNSKQAELQFTSPAYSAVAFVSADEELHASKPPRPLLLLDGPVRLAAGAPANRVAFTIPDTGLAKQFDVDSIVAGGLVFARVRHRAAFSGGIDGELKLPVVARAAGLQGNAVCTIWVSLSQAPRPPPCPRLLADTFAFTVPADADADSDGRPILVGVVPVDIGRRPEAAGDEIDANSTAGAFALELSGDPQQRPLPHWLGLEPHSGALLLTGRPQPGRWRLRVLLRRLSREPCSPRASLSFQSAAVTVHVAVATAGADAPNFDVVSPSHIDSWGRAGAVCARLLPRRPVAIADVQLLWPASAVFDAAPVAAGDGAIDVMLARDLRPSDGPLTVRAVILTGNSTWNRRRAARREVSFLLDPTNPRLRPPDEAAPSAAPPLVEGAAHFEDLAADAPLNEFEPVVRNNRTTVVLTEAAQVGAVVLDVDAVDPDGDSVAVVMETDENQVQPFILEGRRLLLSQPLDSETQASEFTLRIRAIDDGRPFPRESLALYSVSVAPVNEFAPRFDFSACAFRVVVGGGGFSTGRLDAVDLDAPPGPLAYRVRDDATRGCFALASPLGSGELRLACRLESQFPAAFGRAPRQLLEPLTLTLSLVARDEGGLESPPLPITFHIVGADGGHSGDGVHLQRSCQPSTSRETSPSAVADANRRARSSHRRALAELQAAQQAELFPDGFLTANRSPRLTWLTDEADATLLTVPEDAPVGTHVATLAAEDPDPGDWYNGLLRAVVEEPDSQSGSSFAATVVELGSRRRRYFALTTSTLLDRERRAEHRLLLSVCDRGRPPLCSGPPLRALVRLADVNDNPPVFAEAHAAALVTLAEDAPPGAEVYALKAADPDAGANGTVSYRFADPVDAAVAAAFELNSTTGRLQVGAGGLRAAAGGVAALELTLLAEDGGQPPLDARLNLRVELADVNDQRPLFRTTNRDQPGQLTLSIPELLPAGSVLTTLIATDGDSGDNGRVSYRLRGLPFALETFAISRRTGCLRLRRRLTAAAAPYRLFAVAFDHGRPAPRESVLYLLVLVTAGRPAPLSAEASLLLQFARPAYDFEVAEGLPAGQSVGQVVATADEVTDPDAVADYKILGGSRLFAIDSGGEIRTLAPLDRERHPRGLWLTVAASAAAPAATCEIHVTILDVNDCRPVASDRAHYRLLLAEGALPGIELLTAIPAEDCDSDPANGRVRFEIAVGNEDGHFAMDPLTGRLTTTNVTIDREASDRFELVVSLTDQGSPALTSPVLIEIQVLDINDSPPSFLERQFSFAAFDGAPDDWENLPDGYPTAPASSSVRQSSASPPAIPLGRLAAADPDSDPDNSAIAFSLVDGGEDSATASLGLDRGTGQLWLRPRTSARWQRTAIIRALAIAVDPGRPEYSASANVQVTLLRADDSLQQMPSKPDGHEMIDLGVPEGVVFPLPEDALPGSAVPGAIAVPAAGWPAVAVLLRLTGAGSEDFYLPQLGGRLTVARRLNCSRRSRYRLRLVGFDGLRVASRTLEVSLQPGRGRSPQFSLPKYELEVSEAAPVDGADLLTVSAVDPDPAPLLQPESQLFQPLPLQFSIYSAEQSASLRLFSINPLTGAVSLAASADGLDFETSSRHRLLLRVAAPRYGAPGRRRAGFAWLTVRVLDANEAAPALAASVGLAELRAGAEAGRPLGRLRGFDSDAAGEVEGDGELVYDIQSGNQLGLFAIDPLTGRIRAALPVNPAAVSTVPHRLTVTVSDGGRPPLTASYPLTIAAAPSPPLPTEESPPWSSQPPLTVSPRSALVAVSEAADQLRAFLTIVDVTGAPPGHPIGLSVSELAGPATPASAALFISAATGAPDREAAGGDLRRLRVTARDLWTGRTGAADLSVLIEDANDNRPEFESTAGRLSGKLSSSSSLVLDASGRAPLRVRATDGDLGANAMVTYEIPEVQAARIFAVDPDVGVLRLRPQSLQASQLMPRVFDFRVFARDRGSPTSLRSLRHLSVRVELDGPPPQSPNFIQVWPSANLRLELPTYPGMRLARLLGAARSAVRLADESGAAVSFVQLDPDTGWLTAALETPTAPLTPGRRNLTLMTSSGGRRGRSLGNISVSVVAATEAAILTLRPEGLAVTIQEETTAPRLVDFRARPRPIGQPVGYSLAGPGAIHTGHFAVHPTTGRLSATSGIDADGLRGAHGGPDRRLAVNIRVDGLGRRVGRGVVFVDVSDINDNSPRLLGQPYGAILRPAAAVPGRHLLTLRALDADSGMFGDVTYQLDASVTSPEFRDAFVLNASHGGLSLRRALPSGAVALVGVRAADGGGRSVGAVARVAVLLAGQPIFRPEFRAVAAPESLSIGALVALVSAEVGEGGGEFGLVYEIESGDGDGLFWLDFGLGINSDRHCSVRTAGRLDFESAGQHELLIAATDSATGLSGRMRLLIGVLDVNDEAPEFELPSYQLEVCESEQPGARPLATAVAKDADSGAGGRVTYGLEGPANASFEVRPDSGQIWLRAALDFETVTEHRGWLTAIDSGEPRLTASAPLTIRILNFNDNPPVFIRPEFEAALPASSAPGSFVAAVRAVDADDDEGDADSALLYALEPSSKSSLLRIDSSSGEVTYWPGPHSAANATIEVVAGLLATDGALAGRALL